MSAKKKLIQFNYKGKIFFFTYEINPLTNQMEPHIWLRHTIEPETAIKAFFNITEQSYNPQYKRYEAYSESYNLEIYYNFLGNKDYKILIIMAATPREVR